MRVAEVMSRGVDPVAPTATVQEAATQMAEFDVGAVLIGDEDELIGVLTDRDIILRVVVEGMHPSEIAVEDVMSKTVHSCHEDDSLEDALATMREHQIRRMPVLDEKGKTIGIVTLSDLAKGIEGPEHLQETIRKLSEPHRDREKPEPEEAEDEEEGESEEHEAEASEAKAKSKTTEKAAKRG